MIRTSHYLFAALCLGSLFACSRQFTDSYIVPKWCFAVFMLFIVLAYEAVNILFYRQYLQLIIPQYFISNKSGIWSLSLIVHSKG